MRILLGRVEDPRFFNRVATKSTVSQLTGVCVLGPGVWLERFRPDDLCVVFWLNIWLSKNEPPRQVTSLSYKGSSVQQSLFDVP